MAIIICDFDDVLFNTALFKPPLFQFLAHLSGKNPHHFYGEAEGEGYYNTNRHVALLADGDVATARAFKRRIGAWIRRSAAPYLFDDTSSFLQRLARRGHTVCLLTKGTTWFQQAKIRGCGVDKLAHRIYIVEKATKVATCARLTHRHEGPFILLEDTALEIGRLKRAVPTLTAIHVTRWRELPRAPLADHRVDQLEEALEVITSHD